MSNWLSYVFYLLLFHHLCPNFLRLFMFLLRAFVFLFFFFSHFHNLSFIKLSIVLLRDFAFLVFFTFSIFTIFHLIFNFFIIFKVLISIIFQMILDHHIGSLIVTVIFWQVHDCLGPIWVDS